MSFCSQFKSLLRKNLILWYRNLCGSLCELLFPIIIMLLMVLIRMAISDDNVTAQDYLDPTTGKAYYFDDTIQTRLPTVPLTGLPTQFGLYPGNPFLSCLFLKRPIMAFVGTNELYPFIERSLFSPTGTLSAMTGSMAFTAQYFKDSNALYDYVTDKDYENVPTKLGVCAGIEITGTAGDYKVSLRFDDNDFEGAPGDTKQIPSTRYPLVNTLIKTPDNSSYAKYRDSGFIYLQYLITDVILKQNDASAKLRIGVIPMKTISYVKDLFLSGAGEMLGFIIVLCYLPMIFRITSMVVQDKELKTREGMKMMGLKDTAYWSSLFAYYLLIILVIGFLLSGIMQGFFYKYSNYFILFLYFLFYGTAVFAFGVFIASFFHRSRLASITSVMLYVVSYIIINMVSQATVGETNKNFASLLPTVAVCLGSTSIIKYETGQYGLDFQNASERSDNYRFSVALIMLFVDTVLYLLLGIYLDNVLPSPTGVRKSIFFLFEKEFWSETSTDEQIQKDARVKSGNLIDKEEDEILYPDEHFQKVGEELKVQERNNECLKIRHLNKQFDMKKVVSDFSVNMYKGQIFALLGQNGAGKTTTISMLSGLLPPTTGTAQFAHLSIFKQMSKTREKLGVCPQHDVLFEQLTVKEHLEIFASFKGRADTEKIQEDVDEILKDVELKESEDMLACNLSGGQRRKLSIGIAFIGKSDMIFLDEPTSGIDLTSRKKVWVMLKKYKANKVIILTTHYMEEAEELGDRIGIMGHGVLKCVGTPLHLKDIYKAGYNLVVVKEEMEAQESAKAKDKITEFLTKQINGITLRREVGREITYFMPKDDSSNFKEFFSILEANLAQLRIASYGMTTNTLEEIFLKVVREEQNEAEGQRLGVLTRQESMHQSNSNAPLTELDLYSISNQAPPGCCTSFLVHFAAIVVKRLIISMRNMVGLSNEILVPMLLIIIGFLITKVSFFYDGDQRFFNFDSYSTPQSVIVNQDGISGLSASDFISKFETGLVGLPYTFSATGDTQMIKAMDDRIFNERNINPPRYGSVYLKSLNPSAHLYEYALFANMYSQDSSGAFMSYFAQTVLRVATSNPNYKLKFANYPLPLTYQTRSREFATKGSIISQTVSVALALIPGIIISFIVKEREDSLKHQQLVSGVSLFSYWLANSIIDSIKSLIPTGFAISMLYGFSVNIPNLWVIILVYGFTIIPFTYMTSFLFEKENVSQVATLMMHFAIGVIFSPIITVLRTFDSTREIGKAIGWILRIIPSFSLAYGINNICYVAGKINNEFKPDQLVLQEAKKCERIDLSNDPPALLATHLKKIYRISGGANKTAVDDISFYATKGECIALLGTSGAGKTTAFKMITNDTQPTQGKIFINGVEVSQNFSTVRRQIGYGPQYESCYMSLTVRENLDFYAKLKGIQFEMRDRIVNKMISDMKIEEYQDVEAGNLSGGNKRKLTVAIALLGNPPIVLLDEPSTGVDPQAKRFMWQIIQRVSTKNKNTAVILTTHSMEEAEYLCTKMAMMVGGNFCCIGTPQELKEIFGKGFEVQVNIPTPNDKEETEFFNSLNLMPTTNLTMENIKGICNQVGKPLLINQIRKDGYGSHIHSELNAGRLVKAKIVSDFVLIEISAHNFALELAKEFKSVTVTEHIGSYYKYRVEKMKPTHTIGFLFGLMQDLVKKFGITQYSASQTSLTQIFHSFARKEDYGLNAAEEVITAEESNSPPEVRLNIMEAFEAASNLPAKVQTVNTKPNRK